MRPDALTNHPAAPDPAFHQRVVEVLQQYWGYDTLRPLQLEAIRAGVSQRDSLVVLPTGGGKSLCYQLPPLLTGRMSVVVSPLISLMKDQVDGLRLAQYPAAAMHSGMDADDIAAVRRDALAGKLKLLLVAPERLLTPSFLSFLHSANVGSFAIDEAHCISQWGHDFRPEYRRLVELREAFPDLAIHAYTATATPRVRQDIVQQLSLRDPEVLVGVFDRPNLTYRILPRVRLDDQVEEVLRRHSAGESGGQAAIVYCISRKDTERLAAELTARGIRSEAYHAGLTPRTRHQVQDDFANERLNVVVATVAFGMGIDRSNVRCVVHASMPKTVEHYQQETGRAGRDGLPSECVLFYSASDVMQWKRLMTMSAANAEVPPTPEAMEAQMELLNHMQRLASGARCRHRSLSEYFGQRYPNPNCGACDLCLNELAPVDDAATIAKKIISCVARLHHASGIGFGAAYIADVLRGASIEKIRQRHHDQLSTFGLLRNLDKDRIVSYINQLVDAGGLVRSTGEYAVLQTCAGSAAMLKDQQPVALFDPVSSVAAPRRRAETGAAAGVELSAEDRGLFEALRALRRTVAEQLNIPPYVVFGDTTLEEMARVRPGSLESMAHIRGVGNAKLAEFGERFVRNIVQYCRENKIALDAAVGSRPRRKLAAQASRTSMSAQKSAAFEMFARGASVEEVSSQTQRAVSTTHEYLAEWIEQARPESVGPWVDDRTYAMITDAAAKLNATRYRPIFDHFGGSVSYDQIRIVLSHRKAMQGG